MAVQKAQADVLLHRLHYALALPGWEDAQGRRDAQGVYKASSMRQHRQGSGRTPISTSIHGDFDADGGFGFDGVPALLPGQRGL